MTKQNFNTRISAEQMDMIRHQPVRNQWTFNFLVGDALQYMNHKIASPYRSLTHWQCTTDKLGDVYITATWQIEQ